MKPHFTPAWRVLGASLIQMGRAAEGVAELEAAAATATADPVLLAWLAHAKAMRGECGVATTILAGASTAAARAVRSRVPPRARARRSRRPTRRSRCSIRPARSATRRSSTSPAIRGSIRFAATRDSQSFRPTAPVKRVDADCEHGRIVLTQGGGLIWRQRVVGLLIAVVLAMPVLARAQAAPAKHPDFTGSWKVTNIEMPAPPAGGGGWWGSWIWRSRRLRWTRRSRLRRRGRVAATATVAIRRATTALATTVHQRLESRPDGSHHADRRTADRHRRCAGRSRNEQLRSRRQGVDQPRRPGDDQEQDEVGRRRAGDRYHAIDGDASRKVST